MELEVLDVEAVATPEHFVGVVHHHILYLDVVHLAEHLRGIDARVGHLQVVGIPQCRTSADVEEAAVDGEPVHMPERVVPFKRTVGGYDVATLFDGGFAGADDDVVQMEVVRGKQRTFASELLILDLFHTQ